MKIHRPEIICVSTACAAALISFTWFHCFARWPGNGDLESNRTSRVHTEYQKRDYGLRKSIVGFWPPPPAQRRGARWVYDVFTPPEIFYDEKLEKFSVTAPATTLDGQSESSDATADALTEFQLVEVNQEPFRLQLIGFVRTNHAHLGLFENRLTGEILVAPARRELPELGLVIENIEVGPSPISISEGTPAYQMLAVASIRDAVTGETIILNSAERSFTTTVRATLISQNPPQIVREVGEGDVWEMEGVTYEIEKIHVSPAAVAIKRRVAGRSDIERSTLRSHETESHYLPAPAL